VRGRLGDAVEDLRFERGVMRANALSVQHYGLVLEATIGPLRAMIESGDSDALQRYRADFLALAAESFEDNAMKLDYLMTRAVKR
jgi:hypothetical protein